MKATLPLLLACGLACSTFAQEAKTNAAPELAASTAKLPPPIVTLSASTATVTAPDDSSNSFFVNVDAQPEEPAMIWDIDVTTGFEERTVSWRGSGDAGSDEFSPKKFHLTAGGHKLILVGREPAELKSLAVHPASK